VTGLEPNNFEIIENGARRPVTSFLSVDDPIAIAVVSESPLTDLSGSHGPNQLIQTRSLSDAVRQLVASGKPRKALIITTAASTEIFPSGILIVRTDVNMARKAVVEVCNQYFVGFMSLDQSASVEVVLKQPGALPILKANISK
jgi:hypothetical protein